MDKNSASQDLLAVAFITGSTGIAVGEGGTILRTPSLTTGLPQSAFNGRSTEQWKLAGLYPNPAAAAAVTIHIESLVATTASIRIVSVLGEEMLSRPGISLRQGRNAIELSLSEIETSGTYRLVVESPHGSSATPLVIHR